MSERWNGIGETPEDLPEPFVELTDEYDSFRVPRDIVWDSLTEKQLLEIGKEMMK